MDAVRITDVSLYNQHGKATTFHPFTDALTFAMTVAVSPVFVAEPGARIEAVWMSVEAHTQAVKATGRWIGTLPPEWGTNFWVSVGNNWGPSINDYTTPEDWGLAYPRGDDSPFRLHCYLNFWPYYSPPGGGYFTVAAMDRYFHVLQVYKL